METSYQFYKRMGAKELPLDKLPKNYGWITGCGGDGFYWNFFSNMDEEKKTGEFSKGKDVIMCKV